MHWMFDPVEEGIMMNLYCFYEELLVVGRGIVVDVDVERKIIGWEVDTTLCRASMLENRIFYKTANKWIVGEIVFREGTFLSTKLLSSAIEPRLQRTQLRVTTSISLPIKAEIEKLYNVNRRTPRSYRVWDISEGGIGIITGHRDRFFKLGENLAVTLRFELDKPYVLSIGAKVRRIDEIPENRKKIGLIFSSLPEEARNGILRYIARRQKEIIKSLKF